MTMTLLTVAQAAERLGLKPATIRFWIWRRKIRFVRIGRAVRIPEALRRPRLQVQPLLKQFRLLLRPRNVGGEEGKLVN